MGESGCGKSVTAMSVMRLLDIAARRRSPTAQILFEGRDLLKLPEDEMRRLRGNEIAMIFQEPMTSLNPVFTVGDQITEAVRLHLQVLEEGGRRPRRSRRSRRVGISYPERRVRQYPARAVRAACASA